MTIRRVPGTELEYYLVSFDKRGTERSGDPDGVAGNMSERILAELKAQPVTDVFVVCHGWKGDVPAAIDQYDRWIDAMHRCRDDRLKARSAIDGFKPLIVGLHWPSRPWGAEELNGQAVSFDQLAFGSDSRSLKKLIDDAANTTADSNSAKEALRTIFLGAMKDLAPDHLPLAVIDAYDTLATEMGLVFAGVGGSPGTEGDRLSPEDRYQLARSEMDGFSFGLGGGFSDGLLSVLRQFSFWKMKQRALDFGEGGAAALLRKLQNATDHRQCRFHLMGHSFGCIVVSACIAGKNGEKPLPRPVNSVFLVQGALSYWAYCSNIPVAEGSQGYFHAIRRDSLVAGPILTTQSAHDTAVGKLYPIAAGFKRQVVFDPMKPPKYGALGTFGVRGPGVGIEDTEMKTCDEEYAFEPGVVYNLESSSFINQGTGASGAHNDIAKPEVAHAFWSAAMTTIER